MTPKKLDPNVAAELNLRISNELDAFYFYRSAHNWCENVGYLCAAHFFKEESESELEHSKGLEKFLTDYNVIPNLPNIEKPVLKFESLVDIIEQAYTLEYELYELYEDSANKMLKMDICTFGLMQKYLAIQLASMAEYSTFLNQLELVDKTNKYQVFTWQNHAFKK